MSTDTIRDGEVTLKMKADFRAIIERIGGGAQAATVEQVYAMFSLIASDASSEWYRQVDRESGKSGVVSAAWEEKGDKLNFSVGNNDNRRDKKTGKPILYYIHRPGPLSTHSRKATASEREADIAAGRKPRVRVNYPNPKASDGKYLVVELIRKPAREGQRKVATRLGAQIVAAINNRKMRQRGGS